MSEETSAPEEKPAKTPRSVQVLAALALLFISGGAVASVAYDSIVNNDEASTVLLGTVATGGLGALIVLSGGKNQD